MIQILVFDSLNPWESDYRRDSRGRFAGGGGGGGVGVRKGGITSRKHAAIGSPSRKGGTSSFGRHTQTVTGRVNGRRRSVKVQSTTVISRGAKRGERTTSYVYKVKRGGRIGRAPRNYPSALATGSARLGSRRKPGTPIAGKNVRYLSRGHIAGRAIPFHTTAAIGRGLSANAVRRFRKGKPLAPGYVVSHGAPLP